MPTQSCALMMCVRAILSRRAIDVVAAAAAPVSVMRKQAFIKKSTTNSKFI